MEQEHEWENSFERQPQTPRGKEGRPTGGKVLMQEDEEQVMAGDTRVSVLLVATAEMPESSDY